MKNLLDFFSHLFFYLPSIAHVQSVHCKTCSDDLKWKGESKTVYIFIRNTVAVTSGENVNARDFGPQWK